MSRPQSVFSASTSPPATAATTRPSRLARWSVSVAGGRGRVRRGRLLLSGELLEPSRRVEELVAIDVRVARDGREVGVAEVLGDETGVAELLAQPGRGGVAQRVGGDVLLDPGARRGAADDVGEDRLAGGVRPASPQKTGSVASGCRVSRGASEARGRGRPALVGGAACRPCRSGRAATACVRRARGRATRARRARSGEVPSSRERAVRVGRARRGLADCARDDRPRRGGGETPRGSASRAPAVASVAARGRGTDRGAPSRRLTQRRNRRRRRKRR